MKIADVKVERFHYRSRIIRDTFGHIHVGKTHDAVQTLIRIVTDEGAEGYCFGGGQFVESPIAISRSERYFDEEAPIINYIVRPVLLGEDPFCRERIWQRLCDMQRQYGGQLSDKILYIIDMALWDLAGRVLNLPVYKLLGGYRDKVKAYASTMCGDQMEGGLNTPEAYADFALKCKKRGYQAFKLHTWVTPIPPDPKRDIAACRAVRERVGEEMVLMLDCHHLYSRQEALFLGRELEKLGFYWLEEPLNEYSITSYAWLNKQLDIPILGPESAKGKMQTRAEWILRGASDIIRCGAQDVGGITPLMKTAHLCESFGISMEVHGGGPGNLHALAAMGIPGEYYERGMLHPLLDYETPPPWLNELIDPMDEEGYVHLSNKPGLGWDINFDYIKANLLSE